MSSIRPRRGRASGFTLVELLVVIGVITLLVGLLLPAIQNATASARQTNCISNLSQLAKAIITYHGNYGSYFPAPAHCDVAEGAGDVLNGEDYWDGHKVSDQDTYTWRGKILSFVGSKGSTDDERYALYKCPSVRRFNNHQSFYGSNAYVTMNIEPEALQDAQGRLKYLHFDQIQDHTNTIMVGENNTGHWAIKPQKPRTGHTDFLSASDPAKDYARHRESACWVFFDGAARAMPILQAEERNCRLWVGLKKDAEQ